MDQYEGNRTAPVSTHKYQFADLNPTRFNDPSGRFSGIAELSISNSIVSIVTSIQTNIGFSIIAGIEGGSEAAEAELLQDAVVTAGAAAAIPLLSLTARLAGNLGKKLGALAKLKWLQFAGDFKSGGSFLMGKNTYEKLQREGVTAFGRSGDLWITSSSAMDKLIASKGLSHSGLTGALGLSDRALAGGVVRVDIPDISRLNPRVPTSQVAGANRKFKPGGLTSGGMPELVVDPVSHEDIVVTFYPR